jgi:hypothetical protein
MSLFYRYIHTSAIYSECHLTRWLFYIWAFSNVSFRHLLGKFRTISTWINWPHATSLYAPAWHCVLPLFVSLRHLLRNHGITRRFKWFLTMTFNTRQNYWGFDFVHRPVFWVWNFMTRLGTRRIGNNSLPHEIDSETEHYNHSLHEFINKLNTLIMTYVTAEGNKSKRSHIGYTSLVKGKVISAIWRLS